MLDKNSSKIENTDYFDLDRINFEKIQENFNEFYKFLKISYKMQNRLVNMILEGRISKEKRKKISIIKQDMEFIWDSVLQIQELIDKYVQTGDFFYQSAIKKSFKIVREAVLEYAENDMLKRDFLTYMYLLWK
ncbi:MAG: hypothetical protein N4A36_01830 [Candidatus Gracilibacteria bacterium]|jgi:predicted transcriptional regulator|nr:hypothetical protein [Candidatus Gracilibacteria bacterium]